MKMVTKKPLFLGGITLTEGTPFITNEQHGRELVRKGYAVETEADGEGAVDLTAPASAPVPLTSTSITKPKYSLESKGRGSWIIVDEAGAQVGDFTGTKEEAKVELKRLEDDSKANSDALAEGGENTEPPVQE